MTPDELNHSLKTATNSDMVLSVIQQRYDGSYAAFYSDDESLAAEMISCLGGGDDEAVGLQYILLNAPYYPFVCANEPFLAIYLLAEKFPDMHKLTREQFNQMYETKEKIRAHLKMYQRGG